MRGNRNDRTIQRNYIQKRRFLVAEYELVKAGKHPKFRFAQEFHHPRRQPPNLLHVLQPPPPLRQRR